MYNKRVFLAANTIPSTSSIVCYEGPVSWISRDRPDDTEKFVEIANCASKIRLHQVDIESDDEFIEKLVCLRNEVDQFIEHLRQQDSRRK